MLLFFNPSVFSLQETLNLYRSEASKETGHVMYVDHETKLADLLG